MDTMRESVEDREEVIQQLLSRVDELEQYSRRECLVLNGVKGNRHETEDVDEILLDVISQKLGVKISTNDDIQRCHRLKTRRPRHSPVERQSPRPIIIKFVSYRKRQEVFTSKKKLKGSVLVLTESLTATKQAVLAKAKPAFGIRNCWTNDGRIYISAGEKVSVITSEKELWELKGSIYR